MLISAHRCNGYAEVEAALLLGVDYVEFDVQCLDGETFVIGHDPVIGSGAHLPRYESLLDRLAGRARAHIDLKFTETAPAIVATQRAVERLGADQIIVTTLDDATVRTLRDWADDAGEHLLVGLSLGAHTGERSWIHGAGVRANEVLPHLRYHRSRANLAVAHHWLARAAVRRFARHRRLRLVVWTVDTEASLRYWLRPGRAWLVTTNAPGLALQLRASLGESRHARHRRTG